MARVYVVEPRQQPTDTGHRESPATVTGGDDEAPPAYHDVPIAAANNKGDSNPLMPSVLPSNYAYQVPEGYGGLLLHRLAPRLSPYVYPIVCSACVEAVVLCILVVSFALSVVLVLAPKVPPLLGAASTFGMYIPTIHRLFVLDVRMLSLLLRQFETWFLLTSTLAGAGCVLMGCFSDPHIALQATALMACSLHILLSDAFRLPPRTILISTGAFSAATLVLCACNSIKIAPGVNYDKLIDGRVSPFSLMLGRFMTASAFGFKFFIKLLQRPNHCVILYRPMNRRDLGDASYVRQHGSKPFGSSTSVQPLADKPLTNDIPVETQMVPEGVSTDNYAYSAAAGGYKGMLLDLLSPKLAEWAYPFITSRKAEHVVNAFLAVGGLAALPMILRPIPTRLSLLVVLHVVPYLHRLLLVDTVVYIHLARQFDTWFLFLNWATLLASCSPRFLTNTYVFSFAIISMITCSNALLLDAIRLPPLVTLRTAAHYAVLFCIAAVLNVLKVIPSADYSYKMHDRVNIGAFQVGRQLTLSLFFAAQAVGLWLRPDVYVVIRRPMMRREAIAPMLSGTLRSMTVKLEPTRMPETAPPPASPFSTWDTIPDVISLLVLQFVRPQDCAALSMSSRGCRAVASRQSTWRGYLLSTWHIAGVVKAVEDRQRNGQMCLPFKALFAKTWLSTRNSKTRPRLDGRLFKDVFMLAEIHCPDTGEIVTSATVDLDDIASSDALFSHSEGIKIPLPSGDLWDLFGCTMTISIVDVARGRSTCLFSFHDLDVDCDDIDDIHFLEGLHVLDLMGENMDATMDTYVNEGPPEIIFMHADVQVEWTQLKAGLFAPDTITDLSVCWRMPMLWSSPCTGEPVQKIEPCSARGHLNAMLKEHHAWH